MTTLLRLFSVSNGSGGSFYAADKHPSASYERFNPDEILTPRSAMAREARKKLQGRCRDLLVAMATSTSVFPHSVSSIIHVNTNPATQSLDSI